MGVHYFQTLRVDTKINDILPFQVVNPFFKDTPILVRHLANHTSTILDSKNYGKTYILDDSFTENENTHQGFLGFLKSHQTIELKDFLFNVVNQKGDWYKKKNFLKVKPGSRFFNFSIPINIHQPPDLPIIERSKALIRVKAWICIDILMKVRNRVVTRPHMITKIYREAFTTMRVIDNSSR